MLGFVTLKGFKGFWNLFAFANTNENNQSTTDSNNTNNNSTGDTNIGNGGGNNKKNDRKIFFVIGLAVFLLIIVLAAVDYHKKHSIPQCNDPDIILSVKNLLINNPKFAKINFGIDVKKPFNILSFTEYAPADKTIRKRFCEALINDKTNIKFIIHNGQGKDGIITILSNPSKVIENLLNQAGQSPSGSDSSSMQDTTPNTQSDNPGDTDTTNTFTNNSNDDNNN
jgi:hypothetical protein